MQAKDIVPVRTGALRDSITILEIKDMQVIVGSLLRYAGYVEYGTSRMSPRSFMRPALFEMSHRYNGVFLDKVSEVLTL